MGQRQLEIDFENRRLEQTITIAQEQLSSARLRSEDNKEAIISAKKDLREDTSHSISNLWSPENFYELAALSQYANQVSERILEYDRDAEKILALERLVNSPYFARIDYKFEGEKLFENIYIGRSSLKDDKTMKWLCMIGVPPSQVSFTVLAQGKHSMSPPAAK